MKNETKNGDAANGFKRISVGINGMTPLMMNRISEDTLIGLRTKKKPSKSSTKEETPREEAEKKLHVTTQGDPYIPVEALMASLIIAGQYIRLDGKRQASTKQSSLVPGFITIEDRELPLTHKEWEVDMRPGRNPNGGELVCIVRPRFDKWGFETTILLDTTLFSEQMCRELFEIALSRVGLLEFRPARKGIFGRGSIVSWEVH
jgi:hypothetical protein